MLEPGKITPSQAGFLMILTVLGTANLTMPAVTSWFAGMDAWMTIILGFFLNILLIWVIDRICKTFPKKSSISMISHINHITGRYLGTLIVLGYLSFLIFDEAVITRSVCEFLLISFMPDTPIEVFIIIMLFLSAMVVRAGLEVLARTATFIIPIFLISFGVLLVLLIGEMDLATLLPVFDGGIKPIIYGSLFPAIWQGQFVLMLFIWPYLNRPEKGFRSMLLAAVSLLFIMLSITIVATAILGPLTSHLHFPTFTIVSYMEIGFLTRLDAIFMAVWIAGAFIKISMFYYVICLLIGELFGIKEYKCLVYPVGLIIGAMVIMIAPNMADFWSLFTNVEIPIDLLFEYLVPFGLLGVIYLRGLHKKKRGEQDGA
ncbi:GerAB/ArcD/ProY family transporter [Dehalobacterium formicoaceticum]|uniref:GerAB/ArcD/ProY family transporter n=1 Tax=Dehalobacterium formicoaceticum TaxID=51515 RepID=UPI000B7DAEEA|nr:endospore germination permease [Dehalobacterium formicoaceticum]